MQIKRPSKLYLFIAYFLALAPQKHEPKKGTNICQCQSAAKYAKQLWLTPTHRPTAVDTAAPTQQHICMRVMMTIVQKAHFTGRTQHTKWKTKRKIAQQH